MRYVTKKIIELFLDSYKNVFDKKKVVKENVKQKKERRKEKSEEEKKIVRFLIFIFLNFIEILYELMMLFFNRTGLERVAIAGPLALDVRFLCKNKKEGGSARASLVAALMPKSIPR